MAKETLKINTLKDWIKDHNIVPKVKKDDDSNVVENPNVRKWASKQ